LNARKYFICYKSHIDSFPDAFHLSFQKCYYSSAWWNPFQICIYACCVLLAFLVTRWVTHSGGFFGVFRLSYLNMLITYLFIFTLGQFSGYRRVNKWASRFLYIMPKDDEFSEHAIAGSMGFLEDLIAYFNILLRFGIIILNQLFPFRSVANGGYMYMYLLHCFATW